MKTGQVIRSTIYFITSIFGLILRPIIRLVFRCIYDGSKQRVPPVSSDLSLKSATELARLIRTREVKAETVMETFINRVKDVQPYVNAIVADRFEEALSEAREVDKVLDSDDVGEEWSEKKKPLLGVPLTVKEAFAVKGMPNASGLKSRKNVVGDKDAQVVANLRQAGAIPFIMTNVSECCMWYESANRLYGRTKNAYNTTRIVGGSSGGEACIISTGAAVIGVGSDIGGSIRMPSFFNGVFGHKPSRGLVSNDGQFPQAEGKDADLLSTGPICRYASDLLPLLKIFAGPESSKKAKLDEKVDVKKVKFYNMYNDGGSVFVSPVESELQAAQEKAVKYIQDSLGAQVEQVNLRHMKFSVEMWTARMQTSGGTPFAVIIADKKGKVNCFREMLKWLVGRSDHTLPAIGLGMVENLPTGEQSQNVMLKCLDKLYDQLQELLGDNGVLLYPSHPKIAPYHNEPILYPFNFGYTGIFNALGLPVAQCPLGLSHEGLPVGIQVVAAMNNDRLCIAVARELEKGFGGWAPL